MTQIAIPVEITAADVARERSLGGALGLCIKASGLEPKQVQSDLGFDKGQWSRWESGGEGIVWPKLIKVMDYCGNDAPLLWMNHDRGYDVGSLHKRETETQRENRLLREENAALRRALRAAV